ncbi:MAG: hypothetical protein ABGW95_01745 [Candidatus Poseidoniia archaeon]
MPAASNWPRAAAAGRNSGRLSVSIGCRRNAELAVSVPQAVLRALELHERRAHLIDEEDPAIFDAWIATIRPIVVTRASTKVPVSLRSGPLFRLVFRMVAGVDCAPAGRVDSGATSGAIPWICRHPPGGRVHPL